jgi:hypothetical protein
MDVISQQDHAYVPIDRKIHCGKENVRVQSPSPKYDVDEVKLALVPVGDTASATSACPPKKTIIKMSAVPSP